MAKQQSKSTEYAVVSDFKFGYRNREDVTNLPPGVLIVGSQNVLTNVSDRVQIRQGYALDGLVNYVAAPIVSSFDWLTKNNGEMHMRAGRLTSAGDDGLLQYRIVAQSGQYGDNLAVNGTFTGNADGWVVYTGTVSDGPLPAQGWAYNSNNVIHSAGFVSSLAQDMGLSPLTPYHVHFVVGGSAGSVDLYLNGEFMVTAAFGATIDADFTSGAYGNGLDGLLTLVPTTNFDGTIDGVTVNQILEEGATYWKNLMTDLTSVSFNFAKYYSVAEDTREVLFVDGSPVIYRWNGANAVLLSADNTAGHISVLNSAPTAGGTGYTVGDILTITTGGTGGTARVLTLGASNAVGTVELVTVGSGYSTGAGKVTSGGTGTSATLNITTVETGQIIIDSDETVSDLGFYTTADKTLVINGNTYTYASVFETSFLGISPSAVGEYVNSTIQQAVVTTANSDMTGIEDTLQNALIETLNNQVFVAAFNSSLVYISKVSDYTDYSFSTPRQTGEGWIFPVDDNPIAFKPQENFMYVACGQDLWYNVNFELQTSTVGVTYEQVNALALKTGRRQAPMSQAFVSHMKNNIIVGTQETTIDTFGRVESSLATPQTTNISDPIKLDIDSYDFTGGSIAYWRYYILVAIPVQGIVRIYNLASNNWEAPQTIPISRFYIVDGELYGHSSSTFESYQLFVGFADRVDVGFEGFPIQAVWKFSYQNYGSRSSYKSATKMYVEGYINPNTMLTTQITYELDGCQTIKTFTLDGSDSQFVCISSSQGSLGKASLGKIKLGGDMIDSIQNLPPKFRWYPTFSNTQFFECSISFSVLGTSNRMELLAFGLAATESSEIPVKNMD